MVIARQHPRLTFVVPSRSVFHLSWSKEVQFLSLPQKVQLRPILSSAKEIAQRPDIWRHKLMTLRLNNLLRLLEQAPQAKSLYVKMHLSAF